MKIERLQTIVTCPGRNFVTVKIVTSSLINVVVMRVTDGNGRFDGTTLYTLMPGTRLGVYQALSTRNGGEVISSDGY